MYNTYVSNYLYSRDVEEIDCHTLAKECLSIEQRMLVELKEENKTGNDGIPAANYGSQISSLHDTYNLLTFPSPEINKLYHVLQKYISTFLNNEGYVIKCWFNVYKRGDSINWHSHWEPKYNVWHGFFCVQVGEENESFTSYKVPGIEQVINVPSKQGRLVFGRSDGDLHRSSEWNKDTPRITIAFDLIPLSSFRQESLYGQSIRPNHYIPFKI